VNPIIQMWLKIIFSSILVYKLNEYLLKIVEIALVHVLSLVEDERIFNNLSFMKKQLCNKLITHLELCEDVLMFSFFILFFFIRQPFSSIMVIKLLNSTIQHGPFHL